MRVTTNQQVVTAWAEERDPNERFYTNGSMSAHGGTIYSYATPMAQILREPGMRQPILLLNDHYYSSTTSCHQGKIRTTANRIKGVPTVIRVYPDVMRGTTRTLKQIVRNPVGWAKYFADIKARLMAKQGKLQRHPRLKGYWELVSEYRAAQDHFLTTARLLGAAFEDGESVPRTPLDAYTTPEKIVAMWDLPSAPYKDGRRDGPGLPYATGVNPVPQAAIVGLRLRDDTGEGV